MARPRKNLIESAPEPRFSPEVGNDVGASVRSCLEALKNLTKTEREWVLKSAASYPWEQQSAE